jgi:hypothetical protein
MKTETLPAVASRPVYQEVKKNDCSECHVFICDGSLSDEAESVFLSCDSEQRMLISGLTTDDADQSLESLIESFPLATTIYLSGSESFIWSVSELCQGKGICQEQIRYFSPETHVRSIFCCHCYHSTEQVTHNPSVCGGCGRLLTITEHFSRKNSSYFSYQANAEVSEEIPDPVELR